MAEFCILDTLHRLTQNSRTHLRVGVISTEEGSSIDLSKILQHQSNGMKRGQLMM